MDCRRASPTASTWWWAARCISWRSPPAGPAVTSTATSCRISPGFPCPSSTFAGSRSARSARTCAATGRLHASHGSSAPTSWPASGASPSCGTRSFPIWCARARRRPPPAIRSCGRCSSSTQTIRARGRSRTSTCSAPTSWSRRCSRTSPSARSTSRPAPGTATSAAGRTRAPAGRRCPPGRFRLCSQCATGRRFRSRSPPNTRARSTGTACGNGGRPVHTACGDGAAP